MLSRRWHNQWGDGWNHQRTVTKFMGWRLEKNEVVRCTEFWQAVKRHLWRTTRVVSWLAYISDRSIASSSVHLFYKNQHLSSHFFAFRRKHIVKASPSSLSEIRPFNSYITQSHPLTLFLGKWFNPYNLFLFSTFILPLFGKNLCFLHPSPFFNPSVLGSVTTYRQCLVCQVTSHSSVTGRVTRNVPVGL